MYALIYNICFSLSDLFHSVKWALGSPTSLELTQMPLTGQNGHHQKNLQTINAGEGMEKREPSCTVDGNVNWYSHYG